MKTKVLLKKNYVAVLKFFCFLLAPGPFQHDLFDNFANSKVFKTVLT